MYFYEGEVFNYQYTHGLQGEEEEWTRGISNIIIYTQEHIEILFVFTVNHKFLFHSL